jgi:integrase/recombinase XerC
LALRDRLIVEMLYATGIRVSELCGLDIDDVDTGRRLLRVLGKGNKQRTVPFGGPAGTALAGWLDHGRPALATPDSGPALLLGPRGRRLDPRQARTVVHQTVGAVPGAPDIGPHGLRHSAATHLATPRWPPPSSTPTSRSLGCARSTIRHIRGPELTRSAA